ncbi:unnamed protein product [Microthlaspi erraticum]|uniref:Uncharacterized protein n=1 Tax=Microthlaspi erraticum TaxID=1685480 RepID=A0A6D2IB02_9BRAS|nr:unnamed protein product [Microthlaspi erraticum]
MGSSGYTGRGTGIGGEMNEGGEGGSRNELVSAADCNRAGAKWVRAPRWASDRSEFVFKLFFSCHVTFSRPKEEDNFVSGKGKREDKADQADREVAAFLLDHLIGKEEERFGRVPPTTMVRVKNLVTDLKNGQAVQFIFC